METSLLIGDVALPVKIKLYNPVVESILAVNVPKILELNSVFKILRKDEAVKTGACSDNFIIL